MVRVTDSVDFSTNGSRGRCGSAVSKPERAWLRLNSDGFRKAVLTCIAFGLLVLALPGAAAAVEVTGDVQVRIRAAGQNALSGAQVRLIPSSGQGSESQETTDAG